MLENFLSAAEPDEPLTDFHELPRKQICLFLLSDVFSVADCSRPILVVADAPTFMKHRGERSEGLTITEPKK